MPKAPGSSNAAMSEAEKLNEEVKRAERDDFLNTPATRTPWRQNSQDSASSSISNPQSHINTGTSTKWDDGVEDALKSLVGDEPTRTSVQLVSLVCSNSLPLAI